MGQVGAPLEALEDKKVKVDQKDPEGVNALMHAASGGYIQVVQFLVEKGARSYGSKQSEVDQRLTQGG